MNLININECKIGQVILTKNNTTIAIETIEMAIVDMYRGIVTLVDFFGVHYTLFDNEKVLVLK